MKLRAGTVLQNGRYVIQSVLGEGSFGITYRATQTDVNLPVVIKTLHHRLRQQPGFEHLKQKFQKLALYLQSSEHPNLVRVFQEFEENQYICMVMEYIRGQTLAEILQTGHPLVPSQALNYIQQIALGLQELHQQGFLHGDIAPHNIIRQYGSNSVILTDFSLSREFKPLGSQTHSGIVSTGYAALEQYLPHLKCTPATDIYALSATFYYLLTGQRPVAAPLRECMPLRDRWQQLPTQCSPAISIALHRGLELDAQRRPQTIQDWLALIKNETQTFSSITTTSPVVSVAEKPIQPKMLPAAKQPPALPPSPVSISDPHLSPPPPPRKKTAKNHVQARKKKIALRNARIHRTATVHHQSIQPPPPPPMPAPPVLETPSPSRNFEQDPVKQESQDLPIDTNTSIPVIKKHARKPWLPLTFTLTATTAAIVGAGFGLALRMGVTPPEKLQLFNREQSFPRRENWPGKNLPAVLTESPLKKNYQSPNYPNFTQPFIDSNPSQPQTQPQSNPGTASKAIRPAIPPASQQVREMSPARLTPDTQWKNP